MQSTKTTGQIASTPKIWRAGKLLEKDQSTGNGAGNRSGFGDRKGPAAPLLR